ncbi:hypothetical protein [Propionicicella superfundia]|uniref:hypothetical protein n=1 Tax=Propionicicella superfundia TaxID=348582 RepID=UPI0003F5A27A|nr:hypothetical protein [Propionicicella superfundia]
MARDLGCTAVAIAMVVAMTVAGCSTRPQSADESIRTAASSLIGADGLVRAPEADTPQSPDLYLTAVAIDMLALSAPRPIPDEVDLDVARGTLSEPWFTWSLLRVAGATPSAKAALPAGHVLPSPPERTDDANADAVMLWAWADAASRTTAAGQPELAAGTRLVASITETSSWYSAWRLGLARGLLDLPPSEVRLSPPTADTADPAFETLGYVALTRPESGDEVARLGAILASTLAAPGCTVETMAAIDALSLLKQDRMGAEARERCLAGAGEKGFVLQRPVALGSVATTFTVSYLLDPNAAGLVERDVLDRLKSELHADEPTEENRTTRLQTLAILKLSGVGTDEFGDEIAHARAGLAGTHPVADAPWLADRVAALRLLSGVIELPTLELPREDDLDPDAAIFLLTVSERFANDDAIAAALPNAQHRAVEQALRPEATIGYYRAVAALPSVHAVTIADTDQIRIEEGLAGLRGCGLSDYVYRISTGDGGSRCSFQASLLARHSSFERPI